ncbi:MAG: hypothetical protein ACD_81C00009G0004 [uncultured bacterium]|uniref:Helix-turn-helix type 11 domain-containing protein n=1 Tax=Candidatus Wolfebacteria bacterium GW2011_GWC2_39_22 TaxID=1619013 RepID=A0A0G0NHI9_9BACT|nr:MAG: hypothetical protein ACD_81C00009G0004 [uncultured bacterium]KKR12276.1 MAG: hypothetical protein UT41_C0002G0050 [Candidatus Wolfebacteria bacterium GW2011_GWC2_39_22]HBI25907.1 hypothetical protein [Candidatus Wolfebacteria bacterium]
MKTDTAQKIKDFIAEKKEATPKEIGDFLGITPDAVFKQLKKIIERGEIKKIGAPPKVFYSIAKAREARGEELIDVVTKKDIEENFMAITPYGEMKEGLEGFEYWCDKQQLSVVKTANEYEKTIKKYAAFKKNGLIDGLHKIKSSFKKSYLDHVYYLDFYAIERFGKTKLGQLLLYAKQSQDKALVKRISNEIKWKIEDVIKTHKIDAVCFIPPTVKREVQFMKELERNLNLQIKTIAVVKVKTPVIVPQKTLNKLEDRIENAGKTIIINERGVYKNVLIIDDAVGSGATLNETARQIKEKHIAQQVTGLAITGSFKGFDVISEV